MSVVNSGFQLLSRIYTHCCSPVTMPGRLIQWMGSRDGSSSLRDRSATTSLLMDDTRQPFDSRSICELVYSLKSVNIWIERVHFGRMKVESRVIEVCVMVKQVFYCYLLEIIVLLISESFVFQIRF